MLVSLPGALCRKPTVTQISSEHMKEQHPSYSLGTPGLVLLILAMLVFYSQGALDRVGFPTIVSRGFGEGIMLLISVAFALFIVRHGRSIRMPYWGLFFAFATATFISFLLNYDSLTRLFLFIRLVFVHFVVFYYSLT
jgi:hypothetical protein